MPYPTHPPSDRPYWDRVTEEAHRRGSDGCTGVADFRIECCFQHDLEWNGRTVDGEPISRAETNARFRQCIASRSPLGRYSPMAWIRWLGVSLASIPKFLKG